MTLAQRLTKLQKRLGVTQRELARRMKISQPYVCEIMSGVAKNVHPLIVAKIEELEDSAKTALDRRTMVG